MIIQQKFVMEGSALVIIPNNTIQIIHEDIIKNTYYISPYGDIYSKNKNGYMKSRPDKDGYLEIGLRTINNKQRFFKIHTLVAIMYIGYPESDLKDPTVDHKDSNILNNHFSNLRWMERAINASIRKNTPIGELNGGAVLNEDNVIQICNLLRQKIYTLQQIADMFNVTKSTIFAIKNKSSWRYITEKYL